MRYGEESATRPHLKLLVIVVVVVFAVTIVVDSIFVVVVDAEKVESVTRLSVT